MNWKWVTVKVRGWLGFAVIPVPVELTVSQFKLLLGADPRSRVTVPLGLLPLAENARIYEHVRDFGTVYVE